MWRPAGQDPCCLTGRPAALPTHRIVQTWWPLAASWLLMGAELPVLSAVVARLARPEINLAAYGGVVYPIALIVESPIIMLLAASTALSKDWDSYRRLRRFMMVAGAALTGLHLLVALTPVYYLVVRGLIAAPPEIVEPARIGFIIMTPWTWSIAYRRFNQGVLIRFGHSRVVGVGTGVRLGAEALVWVCGYLVGSDPRHRRGDLRRGCGCARRGCLRGLACAARDRAGAETCAGSLEPGLSLSSFLRFYVPLVLTSLLSLLAQPIGSSAISRMPNALASLAVWPVVSGLIFLLRSMGVAYNEVVVALLDEPQAAGNLRRFALGLAALSTVPLLLLVTTPLSGFWFGRIAALPPDLAALARSALWISILMPALSVMQSWYQGAILHGRRTRGITEAVVIYLLVSVIVLVAGVAWGRADGLLVALAAMFLSMLAQTVWLGLRSRPAIRTVMAERICKYCRFRTHNSG